MYINNKNCINNKCIDCVKIYIKNSEGKCPKCEDELDYCKECEFKSNNIQCIIAIKVIY